MALAIDMVGTHLGSGTKTYNLNFCNYINYQNLNEKIYIFITKDYLNYVKLDYNPKIIYIIKSKIFSNTFFRILWMQFILPFELKKLKIQKLYAPMNMGPIFLKSFNIKLILGLHSNLPWVYFHKMPGNFFRNIFTKLLMEKSIFACDTLIVDSKFAKNEIINLLKIKEDKVFAIHLGIDKKYLNSDINKYYLNNFEYKNYIISVLSCVKYHNIINLLKAFKLLKQKKNIDLKFVFVLQILDKNYFSTIKDFISNNFEKGEIVFLHNLDNKYLVNLYRKATFYIFSSYCEVFGLTSLEAMSQGCPVLISKRSALPEINGEAAEYFDPNNNNKIKESMYKILSDVNYRNDIIAKGRIHYKKFRWEKTVRETIKILSI
jgi:glycosyltransferase involved in cell wall biosynthesis